MNEFILLSVEIIHTPVHLEASSSTPAAMKLTVLLLSLAALSALPAGPGRSAGRVVFADLASYAWLFAQQRPAPKP